MFKICAILIGVLAALYYKFTPNVLEPTIWANPPPLLQFESQTAVNEILAKAVQTEVLYHGPESIAFDHELGTAYVSYGDGIVRSFTAEGKEIGPVFFTGGFMIKSLQGNGLDSEHSILQAWCRDESLVNRLAWNTAGEKKCGRPLGIRFRKVSYTSTY